jgi:hypothetical protein
VSQPRAGLEPIKTFRGALAGDEFVVDRCFAALSAAGFVGFIAVVVCAWIG